MRTPVQRFPVQIHDVYEDARASMKKRPKRSSSTLWALTALATLTGAGIGWYLAADRGAETVLESLAMPTIGARITTETRTTAEPTFQPSGGATEAAVGNDDGLLRRDRLGTGPAQALSGDAWPITLHRAGDGQFYADLSLDGHIVNCRIDPTRARTTLRSTDLPADAGRGPVLWPVEELVLEHLRLPLAEVAVSDDPAAETVIGDDLLGRFFVIEETFDRLRLIPRAG